MSHGEGRFVLISELAKDLAANGQIACRTSVGFTRAMRRWMVTITRMVQTMQRIIHTRCWMVEFLGQNGAF